MSSGREGSRKHARDDDISNPDLVISGLELDINANHQEVPQEDALPDVAYEEAATQDAVRWANLLLEVCSMVWDRADAVNIIRFPAVCTHLAKASKQAAH